MLRILASTVWLAWLGLLALMAGMTLGCVWHPHFLPMTSLLVLLIGSGLALIAGGLWRLARGPKRGQALTWLLLGAAPLAFFVGHAMYGLCAGMSRNFEYTWALKLLIPLGESVMDLEARLRYPERTFGEKVVMISTPIEDARAVVAAMDRHVKAQEARLGRPIDRRVHWVRGPLLGMGPGKAVLDLCMGSPPGRVSTDRERLSLLDLHEVAHCVIHSFINPWSNPSALLSEGYAEAHSGLDPIERAIRAWEYREGGHAFSLRELTGPDWYGRHEDPVYVQGAALTNYILETFGPERLIGLYTTSRPATFADDCRRTLGVGLDELDAAYWAHIDCIMTRIGSPERWRLVSLGLAPGIDRAAWESFLDEYFDAVDRLLAPYQNVRAITERAYSSATASGEESTTRMRYEVARSGPYHSVRMVGKEWEAAYLAHPSRSIQARRDLPDGSWRVDALGKQAPDEAYRRVLMLLRHKDPLTRSAAILLDVADELSGRIDLSSVVVAGFGRATEGGRPLVRVRFEDRATPSEGGPLWSSLTVELAADNHFAVLSHEVEGPDGRSLRVKYDYDRYEEIPVLTARRSLGKEPDGSDIESDLSVIERQFGPVPESEFDPDRFLEGPRVVADDEPASPPSPGLLAAVLGWYQLPLIAGGLCLTGGLALGVWQQNWPRPGG